jgi:uncharacterized membrane protein YfcA
MVAVGVLAGFLSGLFGIGGGIIMVPAMVLVAGLAQHNAAATSLAAIIPIAVVGALIFGGARSVDLPAAAALAVGSLAGVQVGSRVMGRFSEYWLRISFAAFIVCVAVAMLLS